MEVRASVRSNDAARIAAPPERLLNEKERARIAALRSYHIIDTRPEEVFDELARFAASIVTAPIAVICLMDEGRQWFKAKVGLQGADAQFDLAELCACTISGSDIFVVTDLMENSRFAGSALVSGGVNMRFYAGVPLINAEGHALGVLCVIDQVPRELAAEHEAALRTLSRHAMAQLELRRQLSLFICGGKANQGHYSALRHAARAGEFVVRYQPKVDLGSGRVVGLEALLRWDRPGHGLVMPSEFIPLLEESGLILEVGAWVLQQTADRYSDWRRKGIDTPRIAVNVSPCQIRQSDFLDVFERAIAADPRDGGGLDIEITEGVLMENTEDIIRKLRLIRDKGVRIAIDDFGTGYSSLRYLSGLPIDTLKVDTSFIAAMTESAEGMAIVSTIIALAHVLKLTVVAEGVETQEQRKLLRLLRCDQIQGYIFSEPLTSRETENLLTGVSPLERVELSARSAGS